MAATASNTFSDDSSNLALRVEEEPAGLFDYRRNALSETIITTIVALPVLVLVYSLLSEDGSIFVTSIALAGLVTVAFATIRYTLSPDRLRAVQTKSTLSLASRTLEYMRGGLSCENCQEVCSILLPETQAMAVAMTDDSVVMGYAGRYAEAFPIGSPIHTAATHRVLETQAPEVFWSPGAIGMRDPSEEEAKACLLYTSTDGTVLTAPPAFANRYAVEKEGVASLEVGKILSGRDGVDGEFSFAVYSGEALVAGGQSPALKDGEAATFGLGNVYFARPGEYDLTVVETVMTSNTGVSYDPDVYKRQRLPRPMAAGPQMPKSRRLCSATNTSALPCSRWVSPRSCSAASSRRGSMSSCSR